MVRTRSPAPSLGPLLLAQFAGAFNDSAWRLLVPLLAMREFVGDQAAYALERQVEMTRATVVFTLPMILLSIPAALLADRLSKQRLILRMKWLELGLMGLGTIGLMSGAPDTLLLVILGLLGAQSALFSPAKYGILPELLPAEHLSRGNAHLATWTLVAIIAGTAAGGAALDIPGSSPWMAGLVLVGLAGVGVVGAARIPVVPPAGAAEAPGATLVNAWRAIRTDRLLWLAMLGSMFFWGLATLLSQLIFVYVRADLDCSDGMAGATLGLYGVGVAMGSLLAGRWSGPRIEYGLIPLGAIGFGLTVLLFAATGPGLALAMGLMVILGAASGLLMVPINALVQWRAPAERRGAVIALENVLVFASTLAGTVLAYVLARHGASTMTAMAWAALLTLCCTVWSMWLLPDALLRFVLVLLTRTLYRLNVHGREHVPNEGGVLLVPNHVSFIDGLFLVATINRPIRFIVDATYFHRAWLKPFMTTLGAIPISSSSGPREMLRAMRDAGQYLDDGEIVCIFAEGQITRTGMLLPFRRGMERIAKGRDATIVPVYLDRVWGSIFSREGGRFITKWPKRIPYPVAVSYGAPLPPTTAIREVRRAVQDLAQDTWSRHRRRDPLHHGFIRSARRRPFKYLYGSMDHDGLSRLRGLAGGIGLARALQGSWGPQRRVGILLPPSIPAALVNLAATMGGRSVVNLNYTAGPAGLSSAARQAGLTTVITHRAFLEKAHCAVPDGVTPIWIDEVAGNLSLGSKVVAVLLALTCPVRLLEWLCGARRAVRADDEVTVIFSSGSTGEPKGVILTHRNLDANVEAADQVFRIEPQDRLLGILPLFHSFGYMTMWFVNNHGMGMAFHPNPIDAPAIGELIQRHRVTLLIATPTFLQIYMRRCTPAQFGSLRLVVAGAEKMPEKLAVAFEDHFGIRPLEGYGATECAPVVSTNVPDFRAPGFYQPGARRGTVGHPLPGVTVRVVDPDTFEPLPTDTAGMLLVRGPNIMRGYLDRPQQTAEALRDGWYVTGDIARVDDDGFITITDRLSRFSKIGGEMVPHGRVEEALHTAADTTTAVMAVTAVPDERKGEALAVIHTLPEDRIGPILERLAAMDLPKLYLPRRDHFVKVDALPMLGTGKLDLRKLRALAAEALAS